MFMQQGGVPMRANVGGAGMPMNNFGQGPNVLPGPLAFLEKTTSNIGKDKSTPLPILHSIYWRNIYLKWKIEQIHF